MRVLTNPYKGMPLNRTIRISVDISREEALEIKKVTLENGTLNRIIAMLVHHLYEYIDDNELTLASDGPERLVNHIWDLCFGRVVATDGDYADLDPIIVPVDCGTSGAARRPALKSA